MNVRLIASLLAAALTLAGCAAEVNDGAAGSDPQDIAREPALETPVAQLDAALHCLPFTHPDQPAVLLVHGTFTAGREQYEWNYLPLLAARGFDVCAVTYPDRGLVDQQLSAEYVVHALRRMRAETGHQVAVIGHSQGVAVPRWAIKWWPSARNAVSDFVMIAGPNNGTVVSDPTALLNSLLGGLGLPTLPVNGSASAPLLPEAFRQFPPQSQFVQATNRGDASPGEVDYTAIYTLTDELVQPVTPVPAAALEFGVANPRIRNVLIQDLCPQQLVDHVTIGTTDAVAFALALDAIRNPGPADPARAGGAALCSNVPIVADPALASTAVQTMLAILQSDAEAGPPDLHLSTAEPALKAYAQ